MGNGTIHVATFDTCEENYGEQEYNFESCLIARDLFTGNMDPRRLSDIKFWCEPVSPETVR
jgi:hypothetical protein